MTDQQQLIKKGDSTIELNSKYGLAQLGPFYKGVEE